MEVTDSSGAERDLINMRKLGPADFEPFLVEFANRVKNDKASISLARKILSSEAPGTLSARDVRIRVFAELQSAQREFAESSQMRRCIR